MTKQKDAIPEESHTRTSTGAMNHTGKDDGRGIFFFQGSAGKFGPRTFSGRGKAHFEKNLSILFMMRMISNGRPAVCKICLKTLEEVFQRVNKELLNAVHYVECQLIGIWAKQDPVDVFQRQ